MELLTPKRITGPLQGWLAGEKPEWRDIRVRPLNVTLGAGFSAVKRRSKGTPDRRRRGTPFSDNMMLVC